jgi:hypothetical protein
MDYGEILKRAWDTIWKHKVLWVFGLLASCTANSGGGGGGGGGGGSSNYNFGNNDFFNNNNFSNNFGREFGNMPNFDHFFSGSGNEWLIITAIVLGVLCFVLLLSFIFVLLGSAGQIGLSRGAWWVDEGETDISFSRIWHSIGKSFWRVVLMHVLLTLVGMVLGLVIAVILVVAIVGTFGIALICLLPFLCIFGLLSLVLGILINIMIQYMIPMMVNEDVSLTDAVKQSYELLKNKFWPSVLMGIILMVLQAAVGLIVAIPILILVFGTLGVGIFATGFANMDPSILIVLILAVICLLMPLSLFVNAVSQSYIGSAWTLTYRRLTGHGFGGVSIVDESPVVVDAEPTVENVEIIEAEEAPKKPRRSRKKTDSDGE